MKWDALLDLVVDLPVFPSELLASGKVSLPEVQVQLSRWTASGRLVQLRRGLYVLARRYRRVEPHPFLIANALESASYVSLQAALSFHGVIPEAVPTVTSVTTGRTRRRNTSLGSFVFRHVKTCLLFGYTSVEVAPHQSAFVASPEKALCDLAYLTSGPMPRARIAELRLQNVEGLDAAVLRRVAVRMGGQKLLDAADRIAEVLAEEQGRQWS